MNASGDALPPEGFLAAAEAAKVGPDWFDTPLPSATKPAAAPKARKATSKRPGGFQLPDVIPYGVQDNTMTRYAGYLRRAGMDVPSILAALKVESAKRCQPATRGQIR